MANTKEYRDFILEQLSEAPNITCRPMMGEFLLYSNNVLFGGIYDDRLLVKIVPENKQFEMPEVIPYDGSKKPNMVPSRVGLANDSNSKMKGVRLVFSSFEVRLMDERERKNAKMAPFNSNDGEPGGTRTEGPSPQLKKNASRGTKLWWWAGRDSHL